MHYTVYKITSLVDSKVYIGKHNGDIAKSGKASV